MNNINPSDLLKELEETENNMEEMEKNSQLAERKKENEKNN